MELDSKQRRKQVTLFCDGSSLGNGQIAARAAAVALLGYKGIWRAVGEYLGVATNQQAEIAAAAEAAKERGLEGKYLLQIQNTTRVPVLPSLNNRKVTQHL